ncbi:hypothetical protein A1D29_07490 [Pasteurellaceae bacterium Orientalotternb1]|nr:hypothetical protein A1D29_07490 [Pasteurellaceae bacterium Orientalotternb1]
MTKIQTYIEKIVEDEATGAEVKYHEITAYAVDLTQSVSNVTVTSYYSPKARKLGKSPVGFPVTITLQAFPPKGVDQLDWFYQQLIVNAPEGYIEPQEKYYGWADPFLLSGGKIKTVELTEPEPQVTGLEQEQDISEEM